VSAKALSTGFSPSSGRQLYPRNSNGRRFCRTNRVVFVILLGSDFGTGKRCRPVSHATPDPNELRERTIVSSFDLACHLTLRKHKLQAALPEDSLILLPLPLITHPSSVHSFQQIQFISPTCSQHHPPYHVLGHGHLRIPSHCSRRGNPDTGGREEWFRIQAEEERIRVQERSRDEWACLLIGAEEKMEEGRNCRTRQARSLSGWGRRHGRN
jgi:hypothetical protein